MLSDPEFKSLASQISDLKEAPPEAPRGVLPSILLDQIKNTVPFIFDPVFSHDEIPFIAQIKALAADPQRQFNHFEYYKLCLSAHHATVASYVPTDVDNQIRFKLWYPVLPTAVLVQMTEIVLQSRAWNNRPVSARWVVGPTTGIFLSGHHGEWLSTAAGAYSSLRKRAPDTAARVAGEIVSEVQNHALVFEDFKKSRDGLGLIRAAGIIAHNLGDLDRVLEMWNVSDDDPLRAAVFKCGHRLEGQGPTPYRSALTQAGQLNKTHVSHENHRHFALRSVKSLRRSADLLLPMGPFFDPWGARVAKHPALSPKDVGLIVETLAFGWEKLQAAAETPALAPVGYARALAGIIENFPGGFNALSTYVPARIERSLKSGALRAQISIPQKRFEEQRAQIALNAVK
ncbi:MAG: hypothetical protein AABZ55_11115 [Bdellovibrionota bacterium]